MGSGKKSFLTSGQKRKIRNNMTGYAFILPNLIVYTCCFFFCFKRNELGRFTEADAVCGIGEFR